MITEEWQRELEAMPFVSKAKGKMSALLKQKSKINIVHKPRVTYDAFDFAQKRPRDEGTINQSEGNASESQHTVDMFGNVNMIKQRGTGNDGEEKKQ